MKISRLAVMAAVLTVAVAGVLRADDAVRVHVSDYRVVDPLEFEISEVALQDDVPAPPNGISPSDVPPANGDSLSDAVPVPADVGGACKGKGYLDGCCCGPAWTVGVDAIFLTRESSDRVLQTYNVDGSAAARVPGLDNYELGYRISAFYCHPCGDDIEISYMNLDNWSAENGLVGTTSEFGYDFYGVDYLNDVEAFRNRYESDLDSLEINFRRCCGSTTWIYGVRYIKVDEALTIDQDFTIGLERFQTTTSNSLLGLQIGADSSVYQTCAASVNVFGKIGVYLNDSDQESSWDQGGPAYFADEDRQATFVGELGVDARYCISNCLSLRAGYQAFWISDLATAPVQLDSTNLDLVPEEGNVATEDVLFHGGFLGLELRR